MPFKRKFFNLPLWPMVLASIGLPALGQQIGLYAPQPPADSAYVRVIVGHGGGNVDVSVNGRQRLTQIPLATPSPYLVLPAGEHELSLQSGHQRTQVKVKAAPAHSLTVVALSLDKTHKPNVVEDKISGNRLKATLSAHNLSPNTINVWTADGQTQVFSALAPGASASRVVNPIAFDYKVTGKDKTGAQANGAIAMASGGAYTIVITRDTNGALHTQAHTNAIEKYPAKP